LKFFSRANPSPPAGRERRPQDRAKPQDLTRGKSEKQGIFRKIFSGKERGAASRNRRIEPRISRISRMKQGPDNTKARRHSADGLTTLALIYGRERINPGIPLENWRCSTLRRPAVPKTEDERNCRHERSFPENSLFRLGRGVLAAEDRLHVARSLKDAYDFNGPLFAPVDDKVTPHTPETERLARQVAAEMTHARCSSQFAQGIEKFIADAIGCIRVLKVNRDVTPNFLQVERAAGAMR